MWHSDLLLKDQHFLDIRMICLFFSFSVLKNIFFIDGSLVEPRKCFSDLYADYVSKELGYWWHWRWLLCTLKLKNLNTANCGSFRIKHRTESISQIIENLLAFTVFLALTALHQDIYGCLQIYCYNWLFSMFPEAKLLVPNRNTVYI